MLGILEVIFIVKVFSLIEHAGNFSSFPIKVKDFNGIEIIKFLVFSVTFFVFSEVSSSRIFVRRLSYILIVLSSEKFENQCSQSNPR